MNISDYAAQELAPYIVGDDFPPKRTGKELVNLFNSYGCRDIYDESGLPDIGKKSKQRPSRKEYVQARLKELSGKEEIRILLEQIVNELSDESSIKKVENILMEENYNIIKNKDNYSIQGGVIVKRTPIVNEAHFNDIQNRILTALSSAKVSIKVVMAWFTNETLLEKLLEKYNEGLEVEVAIYDDGVNKKYGVDLSGLPYKKIKTGIRGGLMHDKFCVIDNQVVITGSYNWTANAEYKNDENVTVQKDAQQATKYSEEYRRLTTSKK